MVPSPVTSLEGAIAAGTRVDGYRLVGRLGGSGMGIVFAAEDERTGQRVALKTLRAWSGEDATAVTRFGREARAANELSHPAIVRVIATGTLPDGRPYLVMPLLEGRTLAEAITEEGRIAPDVAWTHLRAVAEALAEAHARGILHRDVKPSNIVLREGRPERAVLIDFGLASMPELNTLTEAGSVLGTMGFIAPEQVLGYRDLDARIDVFSLGCVLFQCLTGAAPFSMANTLAAIASVLFETPTRLRALRPELPQALDDLLFAMMARAPADRPRDGADALARLRALHD